jgi:TonB family protein
MKDAAAGKETTAAREANAARESVAANESSPPGEAKEVKPAEPAPPSVVAAKSPESPKASPATDFKTVAQDYLNRLAEAARGDLKYPAEAKAQGWGGTTSIRFELDPGGELGDSYVDVSSGYATLDVAALLAVRKAVSASSPPDVVKTNGLKGTVSITFTPPPAAPGRKS